MKKAPVLPPVDMETYVPAAITVIRRARAWPGLVLHERQSAVRGLGGEVNYPGGIRQHVFYWFIEPLTSEVNIHGKVQTLNYYPGEARFTPAGQPVAFRWSGDVHLLMLGFQPWFFEKVAAELGASAEVPVASNYRKLEKEHPACALMPELHRELECQGGNSIVGEALSRAVAVRLLRDFAELPAQRPAEPAPPIAVLRAVELMRKRLTEALTLEELAGVSGVSPFHFARQFKLATGHPPHDYLIRLRVDRAQELMRDHARTWTLAAIANESGFADQSHMARHFKRVLGVTPGEFAEAYRRE